MSKNTLFEKYKSKLRFFIGDVRDLDRLKIAMNGCDLDCSFCSTKASCFPEYNPFETIKTNILGAQNVIDSAYYNKVSSLCFEY